jgi:hypothetical protein
MKNLCAYNGLAMVALLPRWVLLARVKDRMALVRLPNRPNAANAAIAFRLHFGRRWRRVADPER